MSEIRISASRLKTLSQCSLLFFYQEVLRIPSGSHYKTRIGSAAHTLFECIMHARRRKIFIEIILAGKFNIYDYPAMVRYIKWVLVRDDISLSSVDEIGELLNVAFLGIRKHFLSLDGKSYSPPPYFENERRFKLYVGETVISGFIDLLILWGVTNRDTGQFKPDGGIVIDLKSQGQKFTKASLPSNVQAVCYQLACHKEFGVIPAVEFIMLRHAPTLRTPDKHIQRVEPPSLTTLRGFEDYISSIYQKVNKMGMNEALSSVCQDEGFCRNVCAYYKPSSYWIVCSLSDANGDNPLSSHLSIDKAQKLCKDGEIILERKHEGCAVRWVNNA